MKINDLSSELGVINKDLIAFFKENGFKVSSHMQNATDEMIDVIAKNDNIMNYIHLPLQVMQINMVYILKMQFLMLHI